MLLSALVRILGDELLELRGDCDIGSVSMDSRKKMERGLFFCVPGARFDGHAYALQAVHNGAIARRGHRDALHL